MGHGIFNSRVARVRSCEGIMMKLIFAKLTNLHSFLLLECVRGQTILQPKRLEWFGNILAGNLCIYFFQDPQVKVTTLKKKCT